MSPNERWLQIQNKLSEILAPAIFEMWIMKLKSDNFDEVSQRLTVLASNVYSCNTVNQRYGQLLNQVIQELQLGKEVIVEVEKIQSKAESKQAPLIVNAATNIHGLNSQHTFETFVVGKSNRLAHAASLGASEIDSPNKYNPLFIWGGVGLGKTHLMHAIGHKGLIKNPNLKVCYLSAERFTNEFIASLKNNNTESFRERYRHIDLMLVDDIHFISGKETTQEEFFHTFNALHEAKKQIVLSSDRPPKEISDIEDRLVSRFEWGLVTDIQTPDYETRIAILKKKAEARRYPIPEEVIIFLAEQIQNNIRELEGALNRVIACSELNSEPATVENSMIWLKDLINPNRRGQLTIDQIQQVVCQESGHSVEDLLGSKRTSEIVMSRQIAMYLSRTLTESSLKQICQSFNKKDHTTVLHAIKKIERLLEENTRIKTLVETIKNKL